jgi:hypothetical protein
MSLDATIGGSSSNSYVTVAEADAYFADRAHNSNWTGLAAEDKPNFLISASQMLDWYVTWKGVRTESAQSMDWPRTGVYDDRGELFDDDVVPADIKTAVFELALVNIEEDRTADDDLAGLKEIKAGSLGLKTDETALNTSNKTIPDKVWGILRGYTTRSGIGVVRLIRA